MSTIDSTFSFNADIAEPPHQQHATPRTGLGDLAGLAGHWQGHGFNTIWRPNELTAGGGQDRFLELNRTIETLDFEEIKGDIPNRGLLQPDLFMHGLHYLQQISDRNVAPPNAGLHLEPGLWLNVPATTNPGVSKSIARLASIPHGTTVLAQGVSIEVNGPPIFANINIDPFPIGLPGSATPFPEQNLHAVTQFRTPDLAAHHITQGMVDNPNSVLAADIKNQTITRMVVLQIATSDLPTPGGGTDNTAFLQGGPVGPNADGASVTATFWIEHVKELGGEGFNQLQYSQTVILNFNHLSWPHVTVATLHR